MRIRAVPLNIRRDRMWRLVIESEGERTAVPLKRETYGIGRAPGNYVRLTEQNVSRRHAEVFRRGRHLLVRDLGSYNGTYVNAQRVTREEELRLGDVLQIGDYLVHVEEETTPLPDAPRQEVTAPLPRPTPAVFRPARLVMLEGPTPGSEHALTKIAMVIGRGAEDVDIVIDHNSVSRRHCQVNSIGEGRFEVVDLGSANGTAWNGQRLQRAIVEGGDELAVGEVRFRFVREGDTYHVERHEMRHTRAAVRMPLWSRMLPYVLFVAIVVIGGIAAWWLTRP